MRIVRSDAPTGRQCGANGPERSRKVSRVAVSTPAARLHLLVYRVCRETFGPRTDSLLDVRRGRLSIVSNEPTGQRPHQLIPQLLPGDILFFAPKAGGDPRRFATFAADVQSYPYSEPHPWPHVAVFFGGDEIIDFELRTAADADLPWESDLAKRVLTEDPSIVLSALRFDGMGDDIADAADSLLAASTKYALPGILAFAAASLARLMKNKARETAFDFAYGVQSIGRQLLTSADHTCVTAVAAALRLAGITVTVREPPVPSAPAGPFETPFRALHKYALRSRGGQSQQRTKRAAARVEADGSTTRSSKVARESREILSKEDLLSGIAFDPGEHPDPDALHESVLEYFDLLRLSMLSIGTDLSGLEIVQEGRNVLEGQGLSQRTPSAHDWVCSPAMLHDALLHDALIRKGAQEVSLVLGRVRRRKGA